MSAVLPVNRRVQAVMGAEKDREAGEPDAADRAHNDDAMKSTAHEDPGGGPEPSATLGDSGETRPI